MNATKHSATGYAPASIITPGIDLNEGILFHHSTSWRHNFVAEYIKLLHDNKRLLSAVSGCIKQHKHKQRYANKHTTTSFQKTRLFWLAIQGTLRANQTTHALARTFSGPLQ
jgi:hypothetical protein